MLIAVALTIAVLGTAALVTGKPGVEHAPAVDDCETPTNQVQRLHWVAHVDRHFAPEGTIEMPAAGWSVSDEEQIEATRVDGGRSWRVVTARGAALLEEEMLNAVFLATCARSTRTVSDDHVAVADPKTRRPAGTLPPGTEVTVLWACAARQGTVECDPHGSARVWLVDIGDHRLRLVDAAGLGFER